MPAKKTQRKLLYLLKKNFLKFDFICRLIRTAPSSTVPSLSINNGQSTSSPRAIPRCLPLVNRNVSASPITLTTQLSHTSKYGNY